MCGLSGRGRRRPRLRAARTGGCVGTAGRDFGSCGVEALRGTRHTLRLTGETLGGSGAFDAPVPVAGRLGWALVFSWAGAAAAGGNEGGDGDGPS